MDDPALDPHLHDHALRSLNRVNRLLGADRALLAQVRRFGAEPLSLLDLGCGGGGFPSYAARHAAFASASISGLDVSLRALQRARSWAGPGIGWVGGDARRLPFRDRSVDVVVGSLFLHHFDADDAVRILRDAARVARRGLVIADLARSRTAWMLTWTVTRLVSRSPVFHLDGPRSVHAAFCMPEVMEIARQAGLAGARVVRRFPFRWLLTWARAEAPHDSP